MNIKIEKISDINYDFPYLEVFYKDFKNPFIDIGINIDNTLDFKFYSNNQNINLTILEFEYILNISKEFLSKSIKDNEDFFNLK